MSDVVLRYCRDGELSTGTVVLWSEASEEVVHQFERAQFVPMMSAFAKALRAWPEAGGRIERTDRDGLEPVHLSAADLELFRKDPAAAIRSMTIVPMTIYTGGKGIPTGFDALSETFGDAVYLRRDETGIECAGCATWAPFEDVVGYVTWACPSCGIHLPLFVCNKRWVSVKTEDLIGLADKFYLPRAWNPARWIDHDDLEKKYLEYKKEKDSLR